jgi:hypothetical protein
MRGPILQKYSYFWAVKVIWRIYLQKCSYFLPIPCKKAAFAKITVFLQDKRYLKASPPEITAFCSYFRKAEAHQPYIGGGRIWACAVGTLLKE